MSEDWRALHDRMVDSLFHSGEQWSPRIEAAFRAVPRHLFLPETPLDEVYSGRAVVTQRDADGTPTSSSSEPGVMLVMLDQLQVEPGQRVLEIGAGTGYNAALLAQLGGEAGAVTTIDVDEDVASRARENLARAGFERVAVLSRDGWLGAPERAPFDAIEATVGAHDLAPHWVEQLGDGGLLLVPLRLRGWAQALVCFRREGDALRTASVRGGGFMRLRGAHADAEEPIPIDGYRVRFADAASGTDLALLAELLATSPRTEAIEEVNWWRASYAVSFWEPGAVSVSQGERGMFGLFDARERSLALFEPAFSAGPTYEKRGELRAFGLNAALERLREAMGRSEELRGFWVEARPVGAPPPPGKFLIRRRHYQFGLNWRRDPRLTADEAASS